MTHHGDLTKPAAGGDPRAAANSPIATWAWNVILALLAIWPTAALVRAARSPEFSPSIANLTVVFAVLVLIALAVIAAQPRDRKVNLALAAVACFGAFFVGDLLLGWNQRSLRSIIETFLVRPAAQTQSQVGSLLSPTARDRLPLVDRRRRTCARSSRTTRRTRRVRQRLTPPADDRGRRPAPLPAAELAVARDLVRLQRRRPTPVPDLSHGSVWLQQRGLGLSLGPREGDAHRLCRRPVRAPGAVGAGRNAPQRSGGLLGRHRRSWAASVARVAYRVWIGAQATIGVLALFRRQRPRRFARSGPELVPRSVPEQPASASALPSAKERSTNSGMHLRKTGGRGSPRSRSRSAAGHWCGMRHAEDANLATVRRELNLPDLGSLTADADVLRVFKAISIGGRAPCPRLGGDLYFVMIPNQDDIAEKSRRIGGPCSTRSSRSACR